MTIQVEIVNLGYYQQVLSYRRWIYIIGARYIVRQDEFQLAIQKTRTKCVTH